MHIVGLDCDHKIDNWLGGETGDSGGANVLDRDSEVADRGGRTVAEPLELEWPSRAVFDEDDRIRHRCQLTSVIPIFRGYT